ncbi:MAG: hypothetical protein KBD46_02700, partial [Candidatus Levybacteria bacterium]|nr:hypothetical protein [Candidatus Levybacteria bacterium]
PQLLFPLHDIYTSLDEIAKDIESCAVEVAKSPSGAMSVHDHALLLPLTFEKHYPLKKEYWENPTEKYTSDDRTRAFLRTMEEKKYQRKLLVTPNPIGKGRNTGGFAAALPFFEKDAKMIEHFMRQSDWSVEIKAKESAIYVMGDIMVFNWKTKSFEEVVQDTEKLLN